MKDAPGLAIQNDFQKDRKKKKKKKKGFMLYPLTSSLSAPAEQQLTLSAAMTFQSCEKKTKRFHSADLGFGVCGSQTMVLLARAFSAAAPQEPGPWWCPAGGALGAGAAARSLHVPEEQRGGRWRVVHSQWFR